MDSLPRPRRLLAARILSAIFILPLLIAACSGGPGAASGSDPAGVVKDALAKVAAKDINGVANLACAGQADQVREQFDMAGRSRSAVPGANPQDIVNSITIDTSGVTVGSATVNGDSATVPVTGTMKMTFDKEKLRPDHQADAGGPGRRRHADRCADRRLPRPDERRRPGRAAGRER